jgi:hypothetical protein
VIHRLSHRTNLADTSSSASPRADTVDSPEASACARDRILHLRDDPEAAEAEWRRHLAESPAPADSRWVHRLTYEHDSRCEVTVGEPRKQFRRRRGPRGSYIPNADFKRYGRDTGTVVSGIIDSGDLVYVWSHGPPFGGWRNRCLVISKYESADSSGSLALR